MSHNVTFNGIHYTVDDNNHIWGPRFDDLFKNPIMVEIVDLTESSDSYLDDYMKHEILSLRDIEVTKDKERQYKKYYKQYLNSSFTCPHCGKLQTHRDGCPIFEVKELIGRKESALNLNWSGTAKEITTTKIYRIFHMYRCLECDTKVKTLKRRARITKWTFFIACIIILVLILKSFNDIDTLILGSMIGIPTLYLIGRCVEFLICKRTINKYNRESPSYRHYINHLKEVEDSDAFVIPEPKTDEEIERIGKQTLVETMIDNYKRQRVE